MLRPHLRNGGEGCLVLRDADTVADLLHKLCSSALQFLLRLCIDGASNIGAVGILPTERVRQAALTVGVHQQHLFALPRKADAEVDGCGGFAHASLLVGESDYCCFHVLSSLWIPCAAKRHRQKTADALIVRYVSGNI